MNRHQLQTDRRTPVRQLESEDAPSGSVNIRRREDYGAPHVLVIGCGFLACGIGVLVSKIFLALVVFNGRREDTDFLYGYGLWDALPYAMLAFAIYGYRRSLRASKTLAVTAAAVAGCGLFALYLDLAPFFTPLPPQALCCVGPTAHVYVPILQAGPIAISWVVAAWLYRFDFRKPTFERFDSVEAPTAMAQPFKLIDKSGAVVAMGTVADEGDFYGGEMTSIPPGSSCRALFEEFESIVNDQMFSFLPDLEAKIEATGIRVVFDDGAQGEVKELQIFPTTGDVSFKLAAAPKSETIKRKM